MTSNVVETISKSGGGGEANRNMFPCYPLKSVISCFYSYHTLIFNTMPIHTHFDNVCNLARSRLCKLNQLVFILNNFSSFLYPLSCFQTRFQHIQTEKNARAKKQWILAITTKHVLPVRRIQRKRKYLLGFRLQVT